MKLKRVRKPAAVALQDLLNRTLIKAIKKDPVLARKIALKGAGYGDIVDAEESANDPIVKLRRKINNIALEVIKEAIKEEIEMAKAKATLTVARTKEVALDLNISDLATLGLHSVVRDGHLTCGLTVNRAVIEEHSAEFIKFIEAISKAIDETKPMGPGATF